MASECAGQTLLHSNLSRKRDLARPREGQNGKLRAHMVNYAIGNHHHQVMLNILYHHVTSRKRLSGYRMSCEKAILWRNPVSTGNRKARRMLVGSNDFDTREPFAFPIVLCFTATCGEISHCPRHERRAKRRARRAIMRSKIVITRPRESHTVRRAETQSNGEIQYQLEFERPMD